MFSKKIVRQISAVLTVCMLLAGPMNTSRAEAFPGVTTLAMGGAAGTLSAVSAGALMGALGLGSAVVGLPAIAMIGGVVGLATTFAIGNDDSSRSGEGLGLGALAAGGTGAALAAGGAIFTPWVLMGAAAIGGGALLWNWINREKDASAGYDQRYRGTFSNPFFNPGRRTANRSSTGIAAEDMSVLDRIRNVFDRNRRDDGQRFNNRLVMPDGSLRGTTDIFGRMGTFLNGTSDTGTYGGNRTFFGPGYGNTGYFTPGALPGTDRVGRIGIGAGNGRSGFAASIDTSAYDRGFASAPGSSDLDAAEAAKDAAYAELVQMLDQGAQAGSVDAALDAYRKAAAAVETAKAEAR